MKSKIGGGQGSFATYFHDKVELNSRKAKVSSTVYNGKCQYIVGCLGVVQLGCPVFRFYWVVPPRWGLVSSVFIP